VSVKASALEVMAGKAGRRSLTSSAPAPVQVDPGQMPAGPAPRAGTASRVGSDLSAKAGAIVVGGAALALLWKLSQVTRDRDKARDLMHACIADHDELVRDLERADRERRDRELGVASPRIIETEGYEVAGVELDDDELEEIVEGEPLTPQMLARWKREAR
jgi:hypothetical protein